MRTVEMHGHVEFVSRRNGKFSTQQAAYITGTFIWDQRTGSGKSYTERTERGEVEFIGMLLPDNAPEWAYERNKLWNAVEMREKHPRAQPARTLDVAFPYEYTAEQRRQAALSIGQYIVSRYDVATDFGVHRPNTKGDERNWHVHFIFPGRKFDPTQEDHWAKVKGIALDSGARNGGQNREELTLLREHIAHTLNAISVEARHNVYIEHRSFKDRGLDREPTQHMGQIATQRERTGQSSDIGEHNRQVKARNEERDRLYAELAKNRNQQFHPSYHTQAWESFYKSTAEKRSKVLSEYDEQFGRQEKNMREEMAKLHQSIDHSGRFVRFWKKVTGRTKAEQERLQNMLVLYDALQNHKREKLEKFEAERQAEYDRVQREQKEQEARWKMELEDDLKRETLREEFTENAEDITEPPDEEPKAPKPPTPAFNIDGSIEEAEEDHDHENDYQNEIDDLQRDMEDRGRGRGR